MATNESLIKQMNQPAQKTDIRQLGLRSLLQSEGVQERFKAVLKDKAAGFTSSVLALVNNDSYLSDAQPMSIMTGAMVAATLDLPLDKNLGYAYLVPFNEKVNDVYVKKAQFILGYKGYIQLAQRSGQYKALTVVTVYEGQLKSWNPLTEEFDFDYDGKTSDKVIGYVGYFRLVNGFEKMTFWTREQVENHRKRHAKGRDKSPTGVWRDDFDAMAHKTVLKNLLSKWGILSIEMQKAVSLDDHSVNLNDDNQFVSEPIDVTAFEEVPTESESKIATAEPPREDPALIETLDSQVEPEQAELFETKVKSKLG